MRTGVSFALLLLLVLHQARPSQADLVYYKPGKPHSVTFDARSPKIDGTPTLLLSGAVHYTRVHEQEWGRVFDLAREMGLNTIQTYVFWNAHETYASQVGNATWAGRANLVGFIQAAAERGLWVSVRIGPYICGEYYFGGIPVWMRDSGAKCFRCDDPVWEREMKRWVTLVVDKIRPTLASNGGNVLMLQIENEFGGPAGSKGGSYPAGSDAAKYLGWAVDMARETTTDVPWLLCHDVDQCTQINHGNSIPYNQSVYDFKALCAINGFWMDVNLGPTSKDPHQPSPAWISTLQQGNPGQPLIWTEDQGWFDQWGVAQRVRYPRDQLYGIARFVAHGGSWHNFYMLTGGNNYAKQSGGDVVTAYAPDTAIDFLLLRHEPRFSYYGGFFRVLAAVSDQLLGHAIPTPQPLQPSQPPSSQSAGVTVPAAVVAGAAGTVSLGHCTTDDPAHPGRLDSSQKWVLKPATDAATASAAVASGSFVLESAGHINLCLDPTGPSKPPTLSPCTKPTGGMSWQRIPSTGQFQSVAQRPCQAPAAKGKKCHVCLDQDSSTLDLWDCKPMGSPKGEQNQNFTYVSGTEGIVAPGGLCLTASVAAGAGAESMTYGSVAFLSNMDGTHTANVLYGGRPYSLPNHTVAIVDVTDGRVIFNSSELNPPAANHPDDGAATTAHHTAGVVRSQQGPTEWAGERVAEWEVYHEQPGGQGSGRSKTTPAGVAPTEQLRLTGGYTTDYLWYTTTVQAAESYRVSARGSGILYSYVDGVLLPSAGDSSDNIAAQTVDATDTTEAEQTYEAAGPGGGAKGARPAVAELQILSVAMGMSNGGVGPSSVKGITGNVSVCGAPALPEGPSILPPLCAALSAISSLHTQLSGPRHCRVCLWISCDTAVWLHCR